MYLNSSIVYKGHGYPQIFFQSIQSETIASTFEATHKAYFSSSFAVTNPPQYNIKALSMKFIIAALALVSTAFAAPAEEKRGVCTAGTYSCTPNNAGWQVCDVSGNWVVS